MKIGVLTVPFYDRPLEQALELLATSGVEAVELGTGSYPGNEHCDPGLLLAERSARERLLRLVDSHGMFIGSLSQHGNPLHPDRATAEAAHETWRQTVALAEALGVPVVNAFSGCPGDSRESRLPNWVTCAWPPDYLEILEWQWRECLIPYWRAEEAFARTHGVRVAIEMHPGFAVYTPETMLRLREHTGPNLGCNFDPSHLFWQGIDPVEAIRALAHDGGIFHVHAKDTRLEPATIRRKGVLDTTPLDEVGDRSWSFCTLGLGHDEQEWRTILETLQEVGYDYVVSIEHEDPLLETEQAIEQAIQLLRRLLPGDRPGSSLGADPPLAATLAEADAEAPHLQKEKR